MHMLIQRLQRFRKKVDGLYLATIVVGYCSYQMLNLPLQVTLTYHKLDV